MAKSKTLIVTFGGPGRQKKGRKIGVTMSTTVPIEELDSLITGARLIVNMSADPNDRKDVVGQEKQEFADPAVKPLEATADCAGFNVRPDHFKFDLLFALDEVSPERLDEFAFKSGKLKVTRSGDRPKGADDD